MFIKIETKFIYLNHNLVKYENFEKLDKCQNENKKQCFLK